MVRILLTVCLLATFLLPGAQAIFATQLGVYDWLRQGIGYTKDSVVTKGGNLIVSTEDGVLAALNIRDGSVMWRNALPEDGKVEQFALSEESHTNVVYALISTPSKAGEEGGPRNIVVQGWGVQEGTMLFESYLGTITKEDSDIFDIAYYSKGGAGSLMALSKNTLYDIDSTSGSIKARWSPSDKSSRLSALANRRVDHDGGEILAVGCTASGSSSSAACGKTLVVSTKDKGTLAGAEVTSIGSISAPVGGIKPALGLNVAEQGSDAVDSEGGWVYAMKGSTLQLLSIESGRGSSVTLPALTGGGEISHLATYAQLAGGKEEEDEPAGGAVLIMRCSTSGSCQSDKVHLPASRASSSSSVFSSSSSAAPSLAAASLKCAPSEDSDTRARIGAGRGLHSAHEGQDDSTLFCVAESRDSSGGYGLAVTVLDNADGTASGGSNHMLVSSTQRHGFQGISYAGCSTVPSRKGRDAKAAGTAPLLCLTVTSAGSTIALKRKPSEGKEESPLALLWTREEALSRAYKAALHERPEAMREASHKHKLDDAAVVARSLTVRGVLESLLAASNSIISHLRSRVTTLLPSLADPFVAASSAGASLSAQESSSALAAMQAKLYGFDKLGVFLTSGGSEGQPPTMVAVDMSTETVFWVNELRLAGVDISRDPTATASIIRSGIDTLSLVLSSRKSGTTILDVDVQTGAWTGRSMSLPSMHLLGVFPMTTPLSQSLNALGTDSERAPRSSPSDGASVHGHALLLEHTSSGRLGVSTYPPNTSTDTDTGTGTGTVVGKYLSRVVAGTPSGAKESSFQTLRVLPTSGPVQSRCVDIASSTGRGRGQEACSVVSVPLHDVEIVASSIFSSAATSGAGVNMESIAAVAYQHPNDVVNNRAATLGDDSLLMKYLNPSTALVVTEHSVPVANSSTTTTSQLEVHFLDTVSAKVLYRSSILNGASPVQAVVVENNLMVSYWNSAMKRSEVSSVALFEGMIDRQGLTPWANKGSAAVAQKHVDSNVFNSFSSPLPMAVQKTFVFPKTVTAAASTITQQGVAKKALVVGTSGGQIFSVDRQIINPRRPLENPTNAEKADGLFKYEPYLQLDNLGSPTHNYSMAFGPFQIVSAPSKLESSSVVLSLSRLDLHYNRVIPSLAFDLLSPDFNYPLLCIILAGLFVLVMWMMRVLAARKKAKAWA